MKKLLIILIMLLFLTSCGKMEEDKEGEEKHPQLYVESILEWKLEQPELYRHSMRCNGYAEESIFYYLVCKQGLDKDTYYRWGYNIDTGEKWLEEIAEEEFNESVNKQKSSYLDNYVNFLDVDSYRYYIENGEIWCKDLITERSTKVFDIRQNVSGYGAECIAINGKGQLCLLSMKDAVGQIFVLTEIKPEVAENASRLVSLSDDDTMLPIWAVEYGRLHPQAPVAYESSEGQSEDTRTRVLAELSAGKGPDMLWVSEEDMRILAEKDLLLDLTELIDADTLDVIFPGVKEAGTVDDKLVGLMPQGHIMSMMTVDSIWEEESWDLDTILTLIEQNDDLEAVFGFGVTTPCNMSSSQLLTELVLQNLYDSPFVDWESGKSHFDDNKFVEVLEIAKKYGNTQTYEAEALGSMLEQKKLLAWRVGLLGYSGYAWRQNRLGDIGHNIGLSEEISENSYWIGRGYLVINKNAQYLDTVQDFLKMILSTEIQKRAGFISIREDSIRECLEVVEYYDETIHYFVNGDGLRQEVERKPDGSDYMDEFIEFLYQCGAKPYSDVNIQEIILEEAEGFFSGDYTAQQTAEHIDNRVQLYLDEQN